MNHPFIDKGFTALFNYKEQCLKQYVMLFNKKIFFKLWNISHIENHLADTYYLWQILSSY